MRDSYGTQSLLATPAAGTPSNPPLCQHWAKEQDSSGVPAPPPAPTAPPPPSQVSGHISLSPDFLLVEHHSVWEAPRPAPASPASSSTVSDFLISLDHWPLWDPSDALQPHFPVPGVRPPGDHQPSFLLLEALSGLRFLPCSPAWFPLLCVSPPQGSLCSLGLVFCLRPALEASAGHGAHVLSFSSAGSSLGSVLSGAGPWTTCWDSALRWPWTGWRCHQPGSPWNACRGGREGHVPWGWWRGSSDPGCA